MKKVIEIRQTDDRHWVHRQCLTRFFDHRQALRVGAHEALLGRQPRSSTGWCTTATCWGVKGRSYWLRDLDRAVTQRD